MNHSFPIVFALLGLFFVAQFIGLFVLDNYVDQELTEKTGIVSYKALPGGIERPDVEPNYAFLFITFAVILGTSILLILIKFKKFKIWKAWYFLAVTLSLAVAWTVFIPQAIAWITALIASLLKLFKPNFIVHNFTELFIYSGLAAIFVPILNIFSAIILLLLISAYDMYAVWKSKHMVAMAKFQTSSNMFAGLTIPKSLSSITKITISKTKKTSSKKTSKEASVAILGGGDIAFPLLFAGTIMAQFGFQKAFVIPVFATLGLAILFALSKKGKFYPAMPFVSAGCFVGYGIILLIS